MSVVQVRASQTYDVLVDECGLDDLGAVCRRTGAYDAAFVLTDSNVAPLYLGRAVASLKQAGYPVHTMAFEAGEPSKTLATYGRCLAACAEAGLTRDSVIVALGGGVVGDVAGFVAATYMRGCHCVQVPTSLLACVDSSVGGKTAVDLPAGKNLVGAFFQPDAVLIDTSLLETLPQHFFTDGCAEIIKYGAIRDAGLFAMLETPLVPGDARLAHVIARCVAIKRDVVESDERESGVRQILNFGHTLGHAIEKPSDFRITHGFAVGCGMVLAAQACAAQGLCSEEVARRVRAVVEAYGLLAKAPFDAGAVFQAALSDKKRHGSCMNVVTLDCIGCAGVQRLDLDAFAQFVRDGMRGA